MSFYNNSECAIYKFERLIKLDPKNVLAYYNKSESLIIRPNLGNVL